MLDLVVRDGTVVTPGSIQNCDVGIDGEAVVQLGGEMRGRRELDASRRYVFPGGVDAHVHLSRPWVDDFWSGSLAAIAGGITTLGHIAFQSPEGTLQEAIAREKEAAAAKAAVDYFFHPVVRRPDASALSEIDQLAEQGHASVKIFMLHAEFDRAVDGFEEVMRRSAAVGSTVLVHCEDARVLARAGQELIEAGLGRDLRNFPKSRPVEAEAIATERAIVLAEMTGAPLYVVHLSSAAALDACRRARERGLPVYVETRPLYLHLTDEVFAAVDAAKYIGAPPIRTAADRLALWNGIASGDVHTCCTDHAPWTLEQKLDPTLDVRTCRQGVADLETLRPMIFSEGVIAGRLSLSRFVEITSTNAARLFGLYPKKGTIAMGSDADLVVWDDDEIRSIDGARMRSNAGYSVYDGWMVRGWPAVVIRRGQIVLEHGRIEVERGQGRWVRRAAGERL